jgi:hypothetical protein
MGLDDILDKNEERRARAEKERLEAPVKAQAARNELHKALTDEIVSALRAMGDPALGEFHAVPLSDVPGSNRRHIQVESQGRLRVVLKATIGSPPDRGSAHIAGTINLQIHHGTRSAERDFDWMTIELATAKPFGPPEIDLEKLKRVLYELAKKL